jgi:NAD(P)-dependent dehydrogenase (short-subunit alcohol dehydrogenase family)
MCQDSAYAMSQGAVVNVSSAAALIPGEMLKAYGAAKDKLTKDLAFHYAPQGVRVNSVLPGDSTAAATITVSVKCNFRCHHVYCVPPDPLQWLFNARCTIYAFSLAL